MPIESHNLPNNSGIEASVLGGLMLDNQMFELLPKHFDETVMYVPFHQAVYVAMRKLRRQRIRRCADWTAEQSYRQSSHGFICPPDVRADEGIAALRQRKLIF